MMLEANPPPDIAAMSHMEKKRLLENTIRFQKAADLEVLLDAGLDVNETDTAYRCGLQMAAYMGKIDFVRLLLARGADVNFIFEDGQNGRKLTALDAAEARKNNAEIIDLIKKHGGKHGNEL